VAIPIALADLEQVIGVGEIARYSRGNNNTPNEANVNEAIAKAWSSFRSAALNVFTPESVDALTAETLPAEAKLHVVNHAIAILSVGMNRPDRFDAMNDEAAKWRGYLVADKVRSFDGVLQRSETFVSGVTYSAPPRVFDRARNDYWRVPRRE
jgi:hypothetical protein